MIGSAGNRNRTYDLIITNDALYQLSYSGTGRDFKALAEVGQFKVSVNQHQTQFLGQGKDDIFRLAVEFSHHASTECLKLGDNALYQHLGR